MSHLAAGPESETIELNERQRMVLRALVASYIAEAAPVGSSTLAHLLPVALSSASVRSTLGDLGERGLLLERLRVGDNLSPEECSIVGGVGVTKARVPVRHKNLFVAIVVNVVEQAPPGPPCAVHVEETCQVRPFVTAAILSHEELVASRQPVEIGAQRIAHRLGES
jgi:hypothetical protein